MNNNLDIKYGLVDFSNLEEIKRAALIHEQTPVEWDKDFIIRPEIVESRVKHFFKSKDNSDVYLLMAKTPSNQVVGFHWLEIESKYEQICAHIHSLWVDSAFRGKGIGHKLKSLGEEWAKERDAKFIFTDVFYNNKKMIDFNLGLGFKARQVEMIKDL